MGYLFIYLGLGSDICYQPTKHAIHSLYYKKKYAVFTRFNKTFESNVTLLNSVVVFDVRVYQGRFMCRVAAFCG